MAFDDDTDHKKKRPKIAFTGEEFGFGYQAVNLLADRSRLEGVCDGGRCAVGNRLEREIAVAKTKAIDLTDAQRLPLRSKEQALLAVKSKTADIAVVPFYSPYSGYDFETLRAMASLFTLIGVEQIEATDKLCLAIYEPQVLDLVQSAHPGSGLSTLLKKQRDSWGGYNVNPDTRYPEFSGGDEQYRAGRNIDQAGQMMLRDRIDMVFAGPESARRCKSKLDGLRAAGVDVSETLQSVEPHREMARLARKTLDRSRQINTYFDPRDGKSHYVSTMSSEPQDAKLYGVILPFQVAMMSPDFTIIDPDIEDAEPTKTRFFAVREVPDVTLYEDKYRTTDARTAYWVKRLEAIADPDGSFGAGLMKFLGMALAAAAALLTIYGGYGVLGLSAAVLTAPESIAWLPSISAAGALALGGVLAMVSWAMVSVRSAGERGVRVMFRFRRDNTAASIGDVEDYLRNFGVRHASVRITEDSETDAPAGVVLDVEFDRHDFSYGPFAMLSRRLRGSVVNGALKKAFQRWKNRGVTVLAAMPFENGQAQLPKHQPRRWWSEGFAARLGEFVETLFIRFSRLLFFAGLPLAAAAAIAWVVWKNLLQG